MIVDTPILDESTRGKIKDVEAIEERLDRVLIFSEYLDKQWKMLDKKALNFNWGIVSNELKSDIENIRKRVAT